MADILVKCVFFFILLGGVYSLNWTYEFVYQRRPRIVYEYAFVKPDITKIDSKGYTWYDGQEICMSNGGYLLSIDTAVESRMFLLGNIYLDDLRSDRYYWMGRNRLGNVYEWKATNDKPERDQLRMYPTSGFRDFNKRCMALSFYIGDNETRNTKLTVGNCGSDRVEFGGKHYLSGFICKREKRDTTPKPRPPKPSVVPGFCPRGWTDAGTNKCFKVFERPTGVTHEEAECLCLSIRGHRPNLACPTTPYEIEAVSTLAIAESFYDTTTYWFGLSWDQSDPNSVIPGADPPWIWADNSRVDLDYLNTRYDLFYGNGFIGKMPGANYVWQKQRGDALHARYICQIEKDPDNIITEENGCYPYQCQCDAGITRGSESTTNVPSAQEFIKGYEFW